ncbi:MAG: type II toxin-antitoxin system VapC family toxin [Caldilineaceae bacterium]|nr:type II toxin-antitoxin system VapC family toxin [Caldilineaceae bacterium]
MRKIFVDTSAWAAITDNRDTNHSAVVHFMKQIARASHLVITDYILDEAYTLLLMNVGYSATVSFKQKLDMMRQQKIVSVYWVTEAMIGQAWSIFERFNVDKRWSFTDCVSYAVMMELNITEAFTFDHHFSQMGLRRLPNELLTPAPSV